MEHCKSKSQVNQQGGQYLKQREQRQELTGLLKKYGQAWEPWRKELSKFKNNGEDLLKRESS